MIKAQLYSIIIISIFTSCSVKTSKFPEPNALRIAIANSIVIPFNMGDTVIYRKHMGICGNSSKREFNRHYEPYLGQQPYFDILNQKVGKPVLCSGDSLNALVTRLYKSKNAVFPDWKSFEKDKIKLSILGYAVSNKAVKIEERYDYNDKRIEIEKLFRFKKGKWEFMIIRKNNG